MSIVASQNRLTIVFSCVGRRVELVQAFRAAARRLGLALHVVGTDATPTAPALGCVDEPVLLPPIGHADYIPRLLEVVRRTGARALIPTIDTDLPPLAEHRDEFDAAGCSVMVGDRRVVRIGGDKIETAAFFRGHGIDAPATWTAEEIRRLVGHRFPYILKPRFGSASQSVTRVEDERDLAYHLEKVPDPIVQEFVRGQEFTLDVYVGLQGRPQCVVPRLRWQVRGGEVVKGVVVKDLQIMQAGRRVVEALGESVRGLVTLQCIVTPPEDGPAGLAQRRIRFIEINPRFGGGAPLGIAAGADYPGWLLEELMGRRPAIAFDGFRHGLCMLRYDWSAFIPLDDDLVPRLARPLNAYPQFG